MKRTLVALVLVCCTFAAAAAPPQPTTQKVEVTNPVLMVEVANADPVPVTGIVATAAPEQGRFQFESGDVAISYGNGYHDLFFVPAGKRYTIDGATANIKVKGMQGLAEVYIYSGFDRARVDFICQSLGEDTVNQWQWFACSTSAKLAAIQTEGVSVYVKLAAGELGEGVFRAFISGYVSDMSP